MSLYLKCECKSTADFICPCTESHKSLCKLHAKAHFLHPKLQFIPSVASSSKIVDIYSILENQKKIILEFIEKAKSIVAEIQQTLEKHLEETIKKCDASLEDIDLIFQNLKGLNLNKPCNFLNIYNYLISDSLQALEHIFIIKTYEKKLLKKCKKVFDIHSETGRLNRPMEVFNIDENFLRREIKRVEYMKQLKELKNDNKLDLFALQIYKLCKRRRCRHRAGQVSISGAVNKASLQAILQLSRMCYRASSFTLSQIKMNDDDFMTVFEALCMFRDITPSLDFIDSLTGPVQVEMLSSALERYNSMIHLVITNNCIGVNGIKSLRSCLKSCYRLQELNISGNFICPKGAKFLAECFPYLSTLIDLNISNNNLGPEGALNLKENLPKLYNLEAFTVSSNDLKTEGIAYIMEGLFGLSNICRLDISLNSIDTEGALIVAESIGFMKALSYLYIDMVIGHDGIFMLIQAVPSICKIVSKNLDSRKVIKHRN